MGTFGLRRRQLVNPSTPAPPGHGQCPLFSHWETRRAQLLQLKSVLFLVGMEMMFWYIPGFHTGFFVRGGKLIDLLKCSHIRGGGGASNRNHDL